VLNAASKQSVQLGRLQETMQVPLYARAVESGKPRPILEDPKAVEMVAAIDWRFEDFGQRTRTAGCALRSALFDEWVKAFLSRHPDGTVVEIGAGLNTRFERLDNGSLHWFDLDLPDVVGVRRRFFSDSDRRKTLACSILDSDWLAAVRRSPGPYYFVAETVFVYLAEQQVKTALAQIAHAFPDASVAFDTITGRAVRHANRDHEKLSLDARFVWACQDPAEIERWRIGLRLVESLTLADIPAPLWSRLPRTMRGAFRVLSTLFPGVARSYRFNRFAVGSAG
jgi:O-methyltransferase involved in polyketide biosynthesis